MNTIEIAGEIGKQERGLREFALKLTRNQVDAADLYQETAFRAVKNAHQFKENSNVRGWLMTIMRNIFINDYRKRKVRQTYQDWSKGGYIINNSTEGKLNEGFVNVAYDDLINIIDRLEISFKTPFLMHFQGYKYDEIAEQLGAPLGTIKSRIHTARKLLRNMIKTHYALPELKTLN